MIDTKLPEFTDILIGDVHAARDELKTDASPLRRRAFVRTAFSSIEGLLWFAKVEMLSQHGTGVLTAQEIDALNERDHFVAGNGQLKTNERFVPLTTSVKLLGQLIGKFGSAKYKIDLTEKGWGDLCRAVEVRNRVVHPKSSADLDISDSEISACSAGFEWIVRITIITQVTLLEAHMKRNKLTKALSGPAS